MQPLVPATQPLGALTQPLHAISGTMKQIKQCITSNWGRIVQSIHIWGSHISQPNLVALMQPLHVMSQPWGRSDHVLYAGLIYYDPIWWHSCNLSILYKQPWGRSSNVLHQIVVELYNLFTYEDHIYHNTMWRHSHNQPNGSTIL